MNRIKAQSIKAEVASNLVEELQHYFVKQLNEIDTTQQDKQSFAAVEWFRDEGVHGGGVRYVATNQQLFNRASVNVSQVQYDNDVNKSLASATALSTIIHPENPHAPSVHMHISWTEMKDGKGYWRMMADLNPAIENQQATALFSETLKNLADKQYTLAQAQGDRYFYIPALGRHRGVSHFYLEQYNSSDEQADINLAKALGRSVINCYVELFKQAITSNPNPSVDDYDKQKAYHTLYLFQVLTLDRGTTSGLLVHDQNDQGIMGSLPAQIDKTLLASWQEKLNSPQDLLLVAILKALPNELPCLIDENVKLALASAVRQHYNKYPQALAMQARGNSIPATVNNHKL